MSTKNFCPVSISCGNSKMGSIKSVSLPAVITCRPGCPCAADCYARKLERLYPSVKNAYTRNLECLNTCPSDYWKIVESELRCCRFFRFHVSGDIVDGAYFAKMVEVSARNPYTEILVFTKQYEIVNDAIAAGAVIPSNLHVIFSVWQGLECPNDYNLPEAHVRFRDGSTTARPDAVECGGNCTQCAMTGGGMMSARIILGGCYHGTHCQ